MSGIGIGGAIRRRRLELGLTRKELSARAGLSYSYLSEIENGAKRPSSARLESLAGALGMRASAVLALAESPDPPEEGDGVWEVADGAYAAPESQRLELAAILAEAGEREVPGEPTRARRRAQRLDRGVSDSRAVGALRAPRLHAPVEAVPGSLVEAIDRGSCVAFVGAGFSAAAELPAWGTLLGRLAEAGALPPDVQDHVRARTARATAHAYDEAAQLLQDHLGRETFVALLEEELSVDRLTSAMARRLRWLRGIPFRTILTTNFDELLPGTVPAPETYRETLRLERGPWWARDYWEGGTGAFTLKLHGDLASPAVADQLVITRRDYRRRLYQDPSYRTFLRAVLATNTVLYMGFSFEDAYLNELRSEVLALVGQRTGSAPVAYAIANDVPDETRRHFRLHEGIELLPYDSLGGADHSGFDTWLGAIYEATNPLLRFGRRLEGRNLLWVDPHPQNNEPAFARLADAVEAAGRSGATLETVGTAREAIAHLERRAHETDLVITHWGAPASGSLGRRGTAVTLLEEMRARDLRAPVIVFAAETDAEARRRTALGLGAQDYCFRFESLYAAIERVLGPGDGAG